MAHLFDRCDRPVTATYYCCIIRHKHTPVHLENAPETVALTGPLAAPAADGGPPADVCPLTKPRRSEAPSDPLPCSARLARSRPRERPVEWRPSRSCSASLTQTQRRPAEERSQQPWHRLHIASARGRCHLPPQPGAGASSHQETRGALNVHEEQRTAGCQVKLQPISGTFG